MPDSIDATFAETHLPQLLSRVAAGEEIVLTREGAPVARLLPPAAEPRRGGIIIGLLAGQFEAPADVNECDDEIERLFLEGDIEPPP